jgi:hypothetical protein
MGSGSTNLNERPRLADLIVKAGRVYSMNERRDVFAALAVRDGWIVAASADRDGLDELASEGTQIIDDSELTLLPAFFDIHEHLLDAARNLARVRLEDAHSIDELIALIRERADQACVRRRRAPCGRCGRRPRAWRSSSPSSPASAATLPTSVTTFSRAERSELLAPAPNLGLHRGARRPVIAGATGVDLMGRLRWAPPAGCL